MKRICVWLLAFAATQAFLTACSTTQELPPGLTRQAATGTTIATTSGVAQYVAGSDPLTIDPTLTITSTDTISAASVAIGTGFVSAQDLLVYATTQGITGTYSATTGILSLAGTGTAEVWQTVLRSVRYSNSAGTSAPAGTRTISFSLGGGIYLASTGHFYEFVATPSLTWGAAYTAAKAKTYFGLQGYLATVTSAAENAFITGKLSGNGWMGAEATDTPASPGNGNGKVTFPRTWYWVTGPEATAGAGGTPLAFYNNTASGAGTVLNSMYTNFDPGEPNNSSGNEAWLHFLSGSGRWNDFAYNNTNTAGYVVEYGGMSGDPTVIISASRDLQIISQEPCVISGTTYTHNTANPANPCQVCDAGVSRIAWTLRPAGYPCTSDGLACTTDTCNAGGTCVNTLVTGCLIGGACVAANAANPGNECQACIPATSTAAYSPKANGVACTDDGLTNTLDICNGASACSHTLKGTCTISSTTYSSGAANPTNPCAFCDPATSTTAWTNRVSGFPCSADSLACTSDTCNGSGTCVASLYTGCLISGACVAAGATNPGNDCSECNPALSTTAYSAKAAGVACADDSLSNTLDVCSGTGAGTCTHPLRGSCVISGVQYAGGTANPANPCAYCDPASSTGAWTNRGINYPCSSDSLDCTADSCNNAGVCGHSLFTGCLISGVCVSAGATDPDNVCQECNPAKSTSGYVAKSQGVTCTDDGKANTLDICDAVGTCTHPVKGSCDIDSTEFAGGAANPINICEYCDPSTSTTFWSNRLQGFPCTADTLDCTVDTCNGTGTCAHTLSTGCLIDGACVALGSTDPLNECQECNPTSSTNAFVAKAAGTACADEGLSNTLDVCSGASTCIHLLRGTCVISSVEYAGGTANPENPCAYCDPSTSTSGWTNRIQGFPCTTDDLNCTADTCNNVGTCSHTLVTGCLINDACVASGTTDSSNDCQECNPAKSTTAYSAKAQGVTCTDDGNSTTLDVCNASSSCTHSVAGSCVIGGSEYAGGTANPLNPCEYCEPAASVSAWTARVLGFPCTADSLECTSDTCDGANVCVHTLFKGCLISGICIPTGNTDLSNDCRECNPTVSTTDYVAKAAGVACADDGLSNTSDVCGATGGCTHPVKGTCSIAEVEYVAGTANPANPCTFCDPPTSSVTWTSRVKGFPCTTDNLDCTADTCDGAGTCDNTLSTGCLINGACVSAETTNTSNDCQECNPAKSTSGYVAKAAGVACADDGNANTLDVCSATGECTHPVQGSCAITGTEFPGGAANPANSCEFCDPSTSASTWTSRVRGFPCSSDSLDCTSDTCDGTSICTHTLYTGCLIDGTCIAAEATSPSNVCLACNPTVSTGQYVAKAAGVACTDDNNATTLDVCSSSGICTHPLRGSCVISGVEYAGGAPNPQNPCTYCEPSVSTGDWTNRVAGYPCGTDNLSCTSDTCDVAGTCTHTLMAGCLIDSACVSTNATSPSNGCQECNPAISTNAYVAKAQGVACADDGNASTLDVCNAMAACTHPLAGSCSISGAEYAGGTANPDNDCAYCDPATSTKAWTDRVLGFPCAADNLTCTTDACNGRGACNHNLASGCLISDACVSLGATNPANDCQECNPEKSTNAYMAKAQGVACADDGDPKTLDACNAASTCTHAIAGTCVIAGIAYTGGTANPQNACAYCEPATSVSSWTNRVKGYPCANDNLSCTSDLCDGASACGHVLFTGCLIAGSCIATGATDPNDSTKECSPDKSVTTYTTKTGSQTATGTSTETTTGTSTETTTGTSTETTTGTSTVTTTGTSTETTTGTSTVTTTGTSTETTTGTSTETTTGTSTATATHTSTVVSCTSGSDCSADRYCYNGTCVEKLAIGSQCLTSAQCSTGSCSNGTCNAVAFVGGCQASPGKAPAKGAFILLLACAALMSLVSRRSARRAA